MVVDIAILVSYDKGETWNPPWIHFWSCLFEPGTHFIQIKCRYQEGNDKYNTKQFKKLVEDIEKLNSDIIRRPKFYENIATNGCNLMRKITINMAYSYLFHIWERLS